MGDYSDFERKLGVVDERDGRRVSESTQVALTLTILMVQFI